VSSKADERGGLCARYGKEEKHIQGLGRKKVKQRDHLEDLGVDGNMIFK
jgi:hypothetical protein